MSVPNRRLLMGEETAQQAYDRLSVDRAPVEDLGRQMAELTIPSVYPPEGYKTGDDIPGNNQSVGAQCVNTLASNLMFLAFPPGQPIFRLEAIEYEVQQQVEQDPELWAEIKVALSRLEMSHRKRLQTTPIALTYVQYIKGLLVCGNMLWKHVTLDAPTCHLPSCYVVQRNTQGQPLITIHKETMALASMDADLREFILGLEKFRDLRDKKPWEREVCVYSVCALDTSGSEPTWQYWQELDGGDMLPDTDVETDFDAPPMWPGWLIPVFGQNWGQGYVELFRGDLYSIEAQASSLNDIVALCGFALVGVRPDGQTSIKQIREAKNLSTIPGDMENDVSVFTSQKTADGSFVSNNIQLIARRLAAAFLLQSSIQREGERVTAEEVRRIGQEVDKAMGGTYTSVAQNNQRPIMLRAIRLNEEENPNLPPIPPEVEVQVITGMDAMGATSEEINLVEYVSTIQTNFPQERIVNGRNFAKQLGAAKGLKTDGLVYTEEQVQQQQQQDRITAATQSLVDKGTAPAIDAMAAQMQQSPPTTP